MSTDNQTQSPPTADQIDAGLPAQPASLRDDFALAAMREILASDTAMDMVSKQAKKSNLAPSAIIARMAYRIANEMMKERAK